MRLVSFDPLRTLGIPGVQVIKPEAWFRFQDRVREADWVLFPEYWQVGVLAYAWRKRLFPSPASYHLGHDKVEMTRAFQAAFPAHTPHTLMLPNEPWAHEQVLDELTFPFVAKDRRNSMGRGVWLVQDRRDWRRYAEGREELYAQEHLPIDRDLRVVVVGDRVVTGYWRQAAEGGFHNNVSQGGSVSFDGVPPEALTFTVEVASTLGIDHAGFDVAWVDGHPFLLEFNVRFGTRALTDRGIDTASLVVDYLERATSPPVEPRPKVPRRRAS